MKTRLIVWLVVLEDRHIDDLYKASLSREGAERVATKLMENFWGGRYRLEWKRQEDHPAAAGAFIHHTFSDGPRLHIEALEVEGEPE